MSTIKEKAHEIGWVCSKNYDPVACRQEWCEMAAREGANYVLAIFLEIVENRNFLAFPKSVHQELLDKIKELKGE